MRLTDLQRCHAAFFQSSGGKMACKKVCSFSTEAPFLKNKQAYAKLFLFVYSLLIASTAISSTSLPTIGFCDYCSSNASFSTEAEQVSFSEAPFLEGIHKIYIVNPYSSEVRFFHVSRWFEIGDLIPRSSSPKERQDSGSVRRSSQGYYHAEAIPAPSDPSIEQALTESIRATNDLRQQISGFVDFDSLVLPPELDSAIDLVGPEDSAAGLNRSRMIIALNTYLNERISNLAIALGDLALRLLSRVISQSGLLNNLTITIEFPDGTSIPISIASIREGFQGDPNVFEMEILQNLAHGPGLTGVPGSSGQFTGFYFFGDSGIVQELMQLARRYGIPVTGPGGGTPPTDGTRMTCEIDGNHLKCRITRDSN